MKASSFSYSILALVSLTVAAQAQILGPKRTPEPASTPRKSITRPDPEPTPKRSATRAAEPDATPRKSTTRSEPEATPRRSITRPDPADAPKSTPKPEKNPDGAPEATTENVSAPATTPAPVVVKEKPATPAPATPATTGKGKVAAPELPTGEASDLDVPGQAAVAFFAAVQKGQIEEAYTVLTKGSKIAERPEELKTLKAKTTEAVELFGQIRGYEMIESKAVGHNLLRRTYISLGRDYPLRWRFYFYRSSSQWRLVDLRVDDRLAGIFDETEDRPPEPARAAQ